MILYPTWELLLHTGYLSFYIKKTIKAQKSFIDNHDIWINRIVIQIPNDSFSLKSLGSHSRKIHLSLFAIYQFFFLIKLLALVYNASNKMLSMHTRFCLVMITAILSTILSYYLAGQIRAIIKQFIFPYKDVQFLTHGCTLVYIIMTFQNNIPKRHGTNCYSY